MHPLGGIDPFFLSLQRRNLDSHIKLGETPFWVMQRWRARPTVDAEYIVSLRL